MLQLTHPRYGARLEFAGGRLEESTPAKILVNCTLGLVWLVIGRFVVETTVDDPANTLPFAMATATTLIKLGRPVQLRRCDRIKRIRPRPVWSAPQHSDQLLN